MIQQPLLCHTPPPHCNIFPCNPSSRSLFRYLSVLEKYAVCLFNFLKWYCALGEKKKSHSVSYFFLSTHYFGTLHPDVYKSGLSLLMTAWISALGMCYAFLSDPPLRGPLGYFQLLAALNSMASSSRVPSGGVAGSQGMYTFTADFVLSSSEKLSLFTFPPATLGPEVPTSLYLH